MVRAAGTKAREMADAFNDRGLFDRSARGNNSTRDVALTTKGANALKRAEPYWKRAQEDVARRVGKPKLDALITILGELESLHPNHEEAAD